MRRFCRGHRVRALLAAALSAGAAQTATGPHSGVDAACPLGTNWDFVTHTCH